MGVPPPLMNGLMHSYHVADKKQTNLVDCDHVVQTKGFGYVPTNTAHVTSSTVILLFHILTKRPIFCPCVEGYFNIGRATRSPR